MTGIPCKAAFTAIRSRALARSDPTLAARRSRSPMDPSRPANSSRVPCSSWSSPTAPWRARTASADTSGRVIAWRMYRAPMGV